MIVGKGGSVLSTCLTLQVRAVPSREFILVRVAKSNFDVRLRIVVPHFAQVKIFNELNWVATPELLSWD